MFPHPASFHPPPCGDAAIAWWGEGRGVRMPRWRCLGRNAARGHVRAQDAPCGYEGEDCPPLERGALRAAHAGGGRPRVWTRTVAAAAEAVAPCAWRGGCLGRPLTCARSDLPSLPASSHKWHAHPFDRRLAFLARTPGKPLPALHPPYFSASSSCFSSSHGDRAEVRHCLSGSAVAAAARLAMALPSGCTVVVVQPTAAPTASRQRQPRRRPPLVSSRLTALSEKWWTAHA